MITITFNAFSFLRYRLKELDLPTSNYKMKIKENETPKSIIKELGYKKKEVEFSFINGKVSPLDTPLKDGDRVALIPPGTPGSYRLILGAKKVENLEIT